MRRKNAMREMLLTYLLQGFDLSANQALINKIKRPEFTSVAINMLNIRKRCF